MEAEHENNKKEIPFRKVDMGCGINYDFFDPP